MNVHKLFVRIVFFFISIFIICGILYSCKKESESAPPTITLIHDAGFAAGDTTLSVGAKVKIGINAKAMGANITYINVSIDNGTNIQTLLDSGLNVSELNWTYEIINEPLIIRELCTPNSVKINAAIKAGLRETPGLRIFEEKRVQ